MSLDRAADPSDVSDEEWAVATPYLTLLRKDSEQRDHGLRAVFNGLRFIVRTGAPWRYMPHDLPPSAAVYQPMQRWLTSESFLDVAGDLRAVLRMASEREPEPSAVVLDSRTLRSWPESGARAGYDGAKRKRGSKVHLAVDTLGHPVALAVTPADVGDREVVGPLTQAVQAEADVSVDLAFVDQGDTGATAAEAAQANGVALEVVKAPEAKRGFVLLPRRWVVERSFAWATRCRRLVKDYEGYASNRGRLAHGRLRLSHAQQGRTIDDGFITRSSRAHWLTVEWLPKYTPELDDIERVWRDLKAFHLAHQTFVDAQALDRTIQMAVEAFNVERTRSPLANQRIPA